MALSITFYTPLSITPVATIERLSDGFVWSVSASAFQSGPTFANSKITLTQGTGVYVRTYTASVASLGSPGEICVYIHDDAHTSDLPVAARETVVQSDNEVGRNVTTVGSVSGAVGSVTGAVGSVAGSVAGNVVGNLGGNVTGTVGSVVGNVGGNVVGTVGSVTGNVGGNVVGTVASIVSVSNIVTAIFANVTAGTRTFAELMRAIASSVAGKASKPTADKWVARDLDDTKDVITADTNTDEERTTIVYDLT